MNTQSISRPEADENDKAKTPSRVQESGMTPLRLAESCLPLGFVFAVFGILTAWSWRKWPDLMIDFGNQLYIPWQMAAGKVLYRDLMYVTGGPLSQHLHAVLFTLFEASLTVLVVFNLCILACFVVLLYRLFLGVADRWTAAAVCLVTLSVFSFSQYVGIGNYTYVCSYSYETFHGLVLSVIAIGCLSRWLRQLSHRWAFAGGVCGGAVLLTKPDLYLAIIMTLVMAVAMYWRVSASRFRELAKPMSLLMAGHAVPVTLLLVYYCLVWNFHGGLRAAAAAWFPVFRTSMAQSPFYRWCLGLDQPLQNLSYMLWYFAVFCLVVVYLTVFSRHFLVDGKSRWIVPPLTIVLLVLIYLAISRVPWQSSGKPLPLLMSAGCGFAVWKWWKLRGPARQTMIMPVLWSVFALLLLGKMGLNPRVSHYGFYLAMPAAVFVVFSLLYG